MPVLKKAIYCQRIKNKEIMRSVGIHSTVTNSVTKKDQIEEYDIDHEITAAIDSIDNTIESSDLGMILTDQINNEKLIIKACINHLVEKL